MKATVQIDLFSSREDMRAGKEPTLGVKAVWLTGTEVTGELTVPQVLALLERAKMLILAGVPFEPPEKQVVVVPGSTLTDLKKLEVN